MNKFVSLLLIFTLLISIFTACKNKENRMEVMQKNTSISSISNAQREEIFNYVSALKCEDGGYREVHSDIGEILYDTYYAMLLLKQLNNQSIFEEYAQLLVKEYLSRDFSEIVDLTYEDIVMYFYYYTELCNICKYEIDSHVKEKIWEMTEQARTVYGGYYYNADSQIKENEQNILLYSTEKAVRVLQNINAPVDREYCKAFIDNYIVQVVPDLELYNKISAYDSILFILDVCGFANDTVQQDAEALLSTYWCEVVEQIKGKQIDLFSISQIPHLCRRLNYAKLNELYTVLEEYYQSLAASNGFYCAFSQDGINILATQIIVQELTAMQKDASISKNEIIEKIIHNKIYRSGFLAPERETESLLDETYAAYRILKMLGKIDSEALEYLSNIDISALEQNDLFYYYEFMHSAGLKIEWTQREEETKNMLLQSLEENPLQTDMEYYQMLNALQTLYSMQISIPESIKGNLEKKMDTANSMYQTTVVLLLYYYADIDQPEEVKEEFKQATFLLQNEIQNNKENIFNDCILLYYYYSAIDLWDEILAKESILQISKLDVQPILSDYLCQGGGGGLALTNLYSLLYTYNKGV